MAQYYDNMGKKLWADHAEDLSRFVLNTDEVEVLADLDTEQQIIERQTDITKRVRINNQEAILHVELQLRDSTDKPMWARNAPISRIPRWRIPAARLFSPYLFPPKSWQE